MSEENVMPTSDTPQTMALLDEILDSGRDVDEDSAPERWLKLAKRLERQRNELLAALQGTIKFRNWQLAEGGITPADLLDVWKDAEAAIAKAKGAA